MAKLGRVETVNANYTSAQTNTSLVAAPGAKRRIIIDAVTITSNGAQTVSLLDGSGGTALWGPHYLDADGGTTLHSEVAGCRLTLNTALCLTTVGTAGHTVSVSYRIVGPKQLGY